MKDNENNAESDSRIKEQAKEILMNERVDAIRSFRDIPGEKIYVDSLNLARTADRIVEIRDLFRKSVPVCFVVREMRSMRTNNQYFGQSSDYRLYISSLF